MLYPRAYVVANADAEDDAKGFLRRLLFRPRGQAIGDTGSAPAK